MIGQIWEIVFKQPILAALLWFSTLTGSLGLGIILLTIAIQLVLLPLRLPSIKSARKMRELKPEIDRLREKHKDDKMAFAQSQMELYRRHNVSPLGGILPTLLSLPVIFALYRVLLSTLGTTTELSTQFLWLNITQADPYYILPVLVAGAQFVMSSQMAQLNSPPMQGQGEKKDDSPEEMAQAISSQMKYIFPLMSGFITATLPSGVGLYWFTSVLFAIIQHQVVEAMANREQTRQTIDHGSENYSTNSD